VKTFKGGDCDLKSNDNDMIISRKKSHKISLKESTMEFNQNKRFSKDAKVLHLFWDTLVK